MAAARGASTFLGRFVETVSIIHPKQLLFPGILELHARRRSRGLPFQMPTRLADGLGLESGLGFCCQKPCAPPPVLAGESGSPAPVLRKQYRFRLRTELIEHENGKLSNGLS